MHYRGVVTHVRKNVRPADSVWHHDELPWMKVGLVYMQHLEELYANYLSATMNCKALGAKFKLQWDWNKPSSYCGSLSVTEWRTRWEQMDVWYARKMKKYDIWKKKWLHACICLCACFVFFVCVSGMLFFLNISPHPARACSCWGIQKKL